MTAYYKSNHPTVGSHREQFEHLSVDSVFADAVMLHENTFVSIGDLGRQCEFIKQTHARTKKIPVICLDSNPFHNLDQFADQIQQQTTAPFFIFGCDSRPGAYQHPRVALWPYWLIQQQLEQNHQKTNRQKYRISFLSGVPKNHRLKLFDQIRNSITSQDIVVINRLVDATVTDPQLTPILQTLPWSNHTHLLDVPSNLSAIPWFSSNQHPAYAAMVNITGESVSYMTQIDHNYDSLHFITEKTWKAYRSGCLVINYGIDTLPDTLEHYGFQIWKDYDICGTIDEKIQRIVELFQSNTVEQQYRNCAEHIRFNKKLVVSTQLVRTMSASAIDKFSQLTA